MNMEDLDNLVDDAVYGVAAAYNKKTKRVLNEDQLCQLNDAMYPIIARALGMIYG